jgi:hypothetical protein
LVYHIYIIAKKAFKINFKTILNGKLEGFEFKPVNSFIFDGADGEGEIRV